MRSLANTPCNYVFHCDKCHFVSDNKKDYRRHLASNKHAKRTGLPLVSLNSPSSEPLAEPIVNQVLPSSEPNNPTGQHATAPPPAPFAFVFDNSIYKYCDKCGSKYHSKSGLWKHRKSCQGIPKLSYATTLPAPTPIPISAQPQTITSDQELKTMMMDMLKNNQEFQHKLIQMMCSHQSFAANTGTTTATAAAASTETAGGAPAGTIGGGGATTTNYTNSNVYNGPINNTFNLQFFLNEQCKDAMNITDFASSINLKDRDLDEFGKLGYVEGMSKLFIDCLRETDIFKRPIHCSDARRETLYVKDADKWEREDSENTKITNAVRVVEHKNIVLVNEWAKQNPRCENSSTQENTQYIKMSRAVLDGDDKNIAKVIKRVAKEVVIDKHPNL